MPTHSILCENIVVTYSLYSLKVSTLKEFVLKKIRKEISSVEKIALSDVSVYADKGECIALIGHNGCGKSTLLKCIAGILQPQSGLVVAEGRIAPMIELGAGFDPEMTGRENVYLSCSLLGLTKAEIDAKMPAIEKFAELGMFFNAPVKTYSSGMYMRLGFACTTAIEADIVLIDEILAVGDENFQRKCIEKIRSIRHSGSTVVLVSHELSTVSKMADRVYVLDEGRVVYSGRPAPAIAHYHELMDTKRIAGLSQDERDEEVRQKKLKAKQGVMLGKEARVRDVEVSHRLVETCDNISFKIEIELFENFNDPVVVGFAVHNKEDIRIFGSNTRSVKEHRDLGPLKKGIYQIDFTFNQMALASGFYYVTAAIHNHALDKTLDHQHRIAEFKLVQENDPQNFDGDIIQANAARPNLSVSELD